MLNANKMTAEELRELANKKDKAKEKKIKYPDEFIADFSEPGDFDSIGHFKRISKTKHEVITYQYLLSPTLHNPPQPRIPYNSRKHKPPFECIGNFILDEKKDNSVIFNIRSI